MDCLIIGHVEKKKRFIISYFLFLFDKWIWKTGLVFQDSENPDIAIMENGSTLGILI